MIKAASKVFIEWWHTLYFISGFPPKTSNYRKRDTKTIINVCAQTCFVSFNEDANHFKIYVVHASKMWIEI